MFTRRYQRYARVVSLTFLLVSCGTGSKTVSLDYGRDAASDAAGKGDASSAGGTSGSSGAGDAGGTGGTNGTSGTNGSSGTGDSGGTGGANGSGGTDDNGSDGSIESEDAGDANDAACMTVLPSFGFTPSNFVVDSINVDACSLTTVTLNCGTSTFNSQTLTYDNWCGQTEPTPTVMSQTDGPDVVIVPMLGLSVASGSTLRLIGDKPVILAVYGDASIEGTIDVSSDQYSTLGAGGNSSLCGSSTGGAGMDDTDGDQGASGGGGGGFGTEGGKGGHGRNGATNTTGIEGVVGGNEEISPLRGGCAGGQGGKGWTDGNNSDNAKGGYGGGALQISVSGTLSVASDAVITAAGGGAQKSAADDNEGDEDGGAGGGSGGAILLEASSVQIESGAWLTANGGGGSEGGDTWNPSSCEGANGNASSSDQATSESGGCGISGSTAGHGGDGGKGASGDGDATDGGDGTTDNGDAGGGGGGGAGRIFIRGANECDISASSSPEASTECP
jgi:hypothetical protein